MDNTKKFLIGLAIVVVIAIGSVFAVKLADKPAAPSPTPIPQELTLAFKQITLIVDEPYVYIDGEPNPINSSDLTIVPVVYNDRTYLPVEFIEFAYDIISDFDAKTGDINLYNDAGLDIMFKVDSLDATIGAKKVSLDTAPFVNNEMAYIPIRFFSENSDCDVEYDDTTKQITITSKKANFTDEEKEALRLDTIDSINAMTLSKAAAKYCKHDKVLEQLGVFGRRVDIEFRLFREYLPNPNADFSTINSGTAPWVVYIEDSVFRVTDSSDEPRIYFESDWSSIVEFVRPSEQTSAPQPTEEATQSPLPLDETSQEDVVENTTEPA